jgi:hypothetical protein
MRTCAGSCLYHSGECGFAGHSNCFATPQLGPATPQVEERVFISAEDLPALRAQLEARLRDVEAAERAVEERRQSEEEGAG